MTEKYINAEIFKRRVMEAARIANKPDLYEIAEAICEMVDNSTAEDVVPVVHGEWIPYAKEFREAASYGRYYSYVIPLNYRCSVCNRISENIEPYCYCGAKMDGGAENG